MITDRVVDILEKFKEGLISHAFSKMLIEEHEYLWFNIILKKLKIFIEKFKHIILK